MSVSERDAEHIALKVARIAWPVFDMNCWTYGSGEDVHTPTEAELALTVNRLLTHLREDSAAVVISSGRFHVDRDDEDGSICVSLTLADHTPEEATS